MLLNVQDMADRLRAIKVNPDDERVPTMTEIALVPDRPIPGKNRKGPYYKISQHTLSPISSLAHKYYRSRPRRGFSVVFFIHRFFRIRIHSCVRVWIQQKLLDSLQHCCNCSNGLVYFQVLICDYLHCGNSYGKTVPVCE
jgi:hypothetical protein